ncbi:MAG: hypothetical protein KC493_09625 [Bacteriovoracaceae bacterium]|nr:hypothetical protein [Bacteriovoracaceae bacterium]
MKKLFIISFLSLVLCHNPAHAGLWDWSAGLVTSAASAVSSLWSDDEEVVSPDEDEDIEYLEKTQDDLGDDEDLSLTLGSGFMFPQDDPFMNNFYDPHLGFGWDYDMGTSNGSCNNYDWSLCVYCFNLGFSGIMDVYQNSCDELYSKMPKISDKWERTPAEVDAVCACQEDQQEVFKDGKVQEFMKNAVELKKKKIAEEVIANFANVSKNVGEAKGHPWFLKFYTGENARPESACLPENLKKTIGSLTEKDRNGKSDCQEASVAGLFEMGAEKAKACQGKEDSAACKDFNGIAGLAGILDPQPEERRDRSSTLDFYIGTATDVFGHVVNGGISDNLNPALRRFGGHHVRVGGVGGRIPSSVLAGHLQAPQIPQPGTFDEEDTYSVGINHVVQDAGNLTSMDVNQTFKVMHMVLRTEGACENSERCESHLNQIESDPFLGSIVDQVKTKVEAPTLKENDDAYNKRVTDDYNKQVLQVYRLATIGLMKQNFEKDIPEMISKLKESKAAAEADMGLARSVEDMEKYKRAQDALAEINQRIARHEASLPTLKKIVENPSEATLDDVTSFIENTWEEKSEALNEACQALQDQIQLYCRLEEDPGMYSASDILELDFEDNHKLAAEFSSKSKNDSANAKDMAALLDSLACIEAGKFSKYPKNDEHPTFIDGNGKLVTCASSFEEDEFPFFLKDDAGDLSTGVSDKSKEWGRCGGTKFQSRYSAVGSYQEVLAAVDDGRVTTPGNPNTGFSSVKDQSVGDIVDNYKNSGYTSGVSNSDLNDFKDNYGSLVSPSNYSEDDLNKIASGEISPEEIAEYSNGNSTRREPSQVVDENGMTVVRQNGTVDSNQLTGSNGQVLSNNRLEEIDKKIAENNTAIGKANESATSVEESLASSGDPNSESNSAIADELKALREQIASLRKDNERLALERKLEIEKLKKEDLEQGIANAQDRRNEQIINDSLSTNAGYDPATVTTGSTGSNVSSSNNAQRVIPSGNSGGTVINNAAVNSNVSNVTGRLTDTGTSKSSSGSTISLSADGSQLSLSLDDVINFEGRSDVTTLDSAMSLALSSEKSAFVYDGKYYIKKGDSFIEASSVKKAKRKTASEDTKVENVEDVENLLEKYKKDDKEEQDDESDIVVKEQVTESPVVKDENFIGPLRKEEVDASKRERSYVEKLWDVFNTAGRNLFNLD